MPECHRAESLAQEGKPVEVDQRALISKVLARYPGEFTLFRELLQNADDAHSSTVEIRFETAAREQRETESLTQLSLKCSDIARWTFKNNGTPFRKKDWERLTKIAAGNPDPTKVGAFGVGFYSVFSVTDRPCVSSGGRRVEFFWEDDKNQLFVRQEALPADASSKETTFEIPLREPGGIHPGLEFLRFIATSIIFMAHLKDVKVFFDEHQIGRIQKTPGLHNTVDLPDGMKRVSPSKMFTVSGIRLHHFEIAAETSIEAGEVFSAQAPESLEGFDCSTEHQCPLETAAPALLKIHLNHSYTAKLGLTVFIADVDVKVNDKVTQELKRCTAKKSLPSQAHYSLVYTGKDDYDLTSASQKTEALRSVFQGLRADLDRALNPRIFIGHSTSQTTGIGGHMEAPFIPTVERESIDLVDKYTALWNRELLYIGGFLSRAVYEWELTAIQNVWEEAVGSSNDSDPQSMLDFRRGLHERFLHVLRFFTFHPSTPSPKVAQILRDSFYACSTLPPRLLSSVGVRCASVTRRFDPLCDSFLKHTPMLSRDVEDADMGIIRALLAKQIIKNVTHEDVLQDLLQHILDEGGLVACLRWHIDRASTTGMQGLLCTARFCASPGTDMPLSCIQHFINPDGFGAHIPLEGPLPSSLLPRKIAQVFNPRGLARLGWKEFTFADWLRYISRSDIRSDHPQYDFTRSIDWAENVLRAVSSACTSSEEILSLAREVLGNEKCIPVMDVLYYAKDSYLPTPNIAAFDDLRLPVVRFPSGEGISKEMAYLLTAIGVKRHLPPVLLLEEMVNTGKWSTSELIDYLVQVANDLSDEDVSKLKLSSAFTKEGAEQELFRADELYPPLPSFRQLRLPLLNWRGGPEWQDTSPEAKVMYHLGLRRHPPLEQLIEELCTSENNDIRTKAFAYLCTELWSVYSDYNPESFRDTAFIHSENTKGPCLEKLGNVFLDDCWKTFGFSVTRDKSPRIEELGVKRDPSASSLIRLLEKTPPCNEEMARRWFKTLSEHVSIFTEDELNTLSKLQIVPKIISGTTEEYLTPLQCYLGKAKDDFYSKLFHFVEFGHEARRFLEACHAKHEPSEEDRAKSLLDKPSEFWRAAGGRERYLKELRELAVWRTRISSDTLREMMFEPVLLGIRREGSTNPSSGEGADTLRKPSEIVIVDDEVAYRLFRDSLVIAPRNMPPELEEFYSFLGCPYLSTVTRHKCDGTKEIPDVEACSEFLNVVLHRVPIFLRHSPKPVVNWDSVKDRIDIGLWEALSVSTTLTVAGESTTRPQDVSAMATVVQERMQLWVSPRAKTDKYEIAVSLCRVLFRKVNPNDAVLLKTILSETHDVLGRMGYEVEQLSKPQQCAHNSLPTNTETPGNLRTAGSSGPDAEPLPTNPDPTTPCVQVTTEHPSSLGDGMAAPSSPSQQHSTGINVTNKLQRGLRATQNFVSRVKIPGTSSSPSDPGQVMQQDHIESRVKNAVALCNDDKPIPVDRRTQAYVTKILKKRYCHVRKPVYNSRSLGEVDGVKVMASEAFPDKDSFLREKSEVHSSFVRAIITPIAEIYKIYLKPIRVFYDPAVGCIAFNCQGTLYLNLRYFEEWHYQDVKKGNPQQALSFWFFALAHEIAHNLVIRHNSEHEFWFLAICKDHVKAFSQLIASVPPVRPGNGVDGQRKDSSHA